MPKNPEVVRDFWEFSWIFAFFRWKCWRILKIFEDLRDFCPFLDGNVEESWRILIRWINIIKRISMGFFQGFFRWDSWRFIRIFRDFCPFLDGNVEESWRFWWFLGIFRDFWAYWDGNVEESWRFLRNFRDFWGFLGIFPLFSGENAEDCWIPDVIRIDEINFNCNRFSNRWWWSWERSSRGLQMILGLNSGSRRD